MHAAPALADKKSFEDTRAFGLPQDNFSPEARAGLEMLEQQAQAARLCMHEMDVLQGEYPHWMAAYEDAQPDVCTFSRLLELLQSAPNEFARGLIYGKLSLRAQLSAHTCIGLS